MPSGDYSAEVIDSQGTRHLAPVHFLRIDHDEQVSNRHFTISLPPLAAQTLMIRRGGEVVYEGLLP